MNITEVRVRRMENGGRMKAVASITFDDAFVVRGIRIIEGDKGLFIAMPSRKTREGTFKDIAHPITSEAREEIETAILSAYNSPESETLGARGEEIQ
jgi:stage V sporulation protein G